MKCDGELPWVLKVTQYSHWQMHSSNNDSDLGRKRELSEVAWGRGECWTGDRTPRCDLDLETRHKTLPPSLSLFSH